MSKVELMRRFMSTFVGNDLHLVIREGGYLLVHTIQIIQKTDETCPLREVPIGGYFLRLLVRDENDREGSILCNWSEQLIRSLLEHAAYARESGYKAIMMQRSPHNPDGWLLIWGDGLQKTIRVRDLT